jgi:hypothetical protein
MLLPLLVLPCNIACIKFRGDGEFLAFFNDKGILIIKKIQK